MVKVEEKMMNDVARFGKNLFSSFTWFYVFVNPSLLLFM